MRTKIFAWVLGMLLTMPCALRAEEVEIRLFVVLEMGSIDGLDPLDDSDPIGETPTTPTSFRASINGNQLDVWLIYQCAKCKHTYNLSIYERVKPTELEQQEYQLFLENNFI